MKRLIGSCFKWIGFITVFCIIAGAVGLFLAGNWLQSGDIIDGMHKSDAIVLLAGSYFRPIYAAELYSKGLAPLIYVSRPIKRNDRHLLRSVDVKLPLQEEIFRRLLLKNGVPSDAINFFGESSISTTQEAKALRETIGVELKSLILVTSPCHVRRAKMIFEDMLPNCEVLVVGTPYEPFPKKWWLARTPAINTFNETIKIAFYLLGGYFESDNVPQ